MIILQQAFYGYDIVSSGYALLASSAMQHNAIIEVLCSSIGTPDNSFGNGVIYLNYIEAGYRYMIRSCIGKPDNAGRKTLLFHVFIGKHDELLAKDFSIRNLIAEDAFLAEYAEHAVLPYELPTNKENFPLPQQAIFNWQGEKLAIQSKQDEYQLLQSLLQDKINKYSWASLTFRPLEKFDVYVLSELSAKKPNDRKFVDIYGKLITEKQIPLTRKTIQSKKTVVKKGNNKILSFIFIISVLLNVFLGYKLLFNNIDNNQVSGSNVKTLKKELLRKLDNQPFEKSFLEIMEQHPEINLSLKYSSDLKNKLDKADIYVDFVNKNILNKGTRKND